MSKVIILEEEPGIAGYVIFTLEHRRNPLNIMSRPDKDPLPEVPRQWHKGDLVITPDGVGEVVEDSGNRLIKVKVPGLVSYRYPKERLRKPGIRPHSTPRKSCEVDINFSRRSGIW